MRALRGLAVALLVFAGASCRRDSVVASDGSANAASTSSVARLSDASEDAVADVASPLTAVPRDTATLTIDGVDETWRLEWRRPPLPDCMAPNESGSCACAGFAFGERGELDLVRSRSGLADERLHLAPLFENHDARLMRWDRAAMKPAPASPNLAALSSVPPLHRMVLADYDHDGRATEFLLQLEANACGHTPDRGRRISRKNPALHAFTSVDAPKETFTVDRAADWEQLRQSTNGTLDIVDVACGDHGAGERQTRTVRADGEIHVTTKRTPCTGF